MPQGSWRISPSLPSVNFLPIREMTDQLTPDMLAYMTNSVNWNSTLAAILQDFSCQTGTIHRTADSDKILTLVCQIGVPESIMHKITSIPFGKGIAGVAAERQEAVELCNLQQDLGGVARVDARQTGVSGSIAVPIFSKDTGEVVGTLGIGKFIPYDFSSDEKHRLREIADQIAGIFVNKDS